MDKTKNCTYEEIKVDKKFLSSFVPKRKEC